MKQRRQTHREMSASIKMPKVSSNRLTMIIYVSGLTALIIESLRLRDSG